MQLLTVELEVFAKVLGTMIVKKRKTGTGWQYSVNGSDCGPEQIFTALVSTGIPPGHPYLTAFTGQNDGLIPATYTEVPAPKTGAWNQPATAFSVTFGDWSQKLFQGESKLCFFRKTNAAGKTEFFINKVQCRAIDIVEMAQESGLEPDAPLFTSLLPE